MDFLPCLYELLDPTVPAAVLIARRELHHSLHADDYRNVDNTSAGHFDGSPASQEG